MNNQPQQQHDQNTSNGDTSAKTANWFPDFTHSRITTSGAEINTLVVGSGLPLLLLHGHPETHVA